MTPKQKAKELFDKAIFNIQLADKYGYLLKDDEIYIAKLIALDTINNVISANPHSNPLNTDVYSTMDYWEEVKTKISHF